MAETVRKNLGMVTAYAYAVSKGYTGTEEEFAELMASYADVAQDAEASAQAAAQSATTAEQKATQAAGSATNAAVSATSASESAQAAAGSSNSASLYAQNASASATNAAGSASSASTYAGNASASAQTAEGSANAAQASATQAAGSADDAEAAKNLVLGMNAVAETLPAGSQATASYSNGTLTLGIPKGDTGEKGDPGDSNDAPLIYSSASGSVANFTDGADDLPMKSAVVNIEPIQDLHGYDSPWPAGGGKNLINLPVRSSVEVNGITSSVAENNLVTASGTSTGNNGDIDFDLTSNPIILKANKPYTLGLSGTDTRSGNFTVFFRNADGGSFITVGPIATSNHSITYTPTEDTTVDYLKLRLPVGRTIELNANIQLEAGSEATDYAPYENICPISGRTVASVVRSGKNLINLPVRSSIVVNGITSSVAENNLVMASGTSTGNGDINFDLTDNIILKANQAYTLGLNGTDTRSGNFTVFFRNADSGSFITVGPIATTDHSITYTPTEDTTVDYLKLRLPVGRTIELNANLQLELGSASDYEPYKGTEFSVNWETEAGTVYGGTLNIVSGKLTVDRAYIASYNGETLPSTWISDRDVYAAGTTPTTGAQVVYKLVDPVEYQLTPQEITTLLGTNNIWSDAGDMSVEYPADTKMYIDQKIIEAVAAALA